MRFVLHPKTCGFFVPARLEMAASEMRPVRLWELPPVFSSDLCRQARPSPVHSDQSGHELSSPESAMVGWRRRFFISRCDICRAVPPPDDGGRHGSIRFRQTGCRQLDNTAGLEIEGEVASVAKNMEMEKVCRRWRDWLRGSTCIKVFRDFFLSGVTEGMEQELDQFVQSGSF